MAALLGCEAAGEVLWPDLTDRETSARRVIHGFLETELREFLLYGLAQQAVDIVLQIIYEGGTRMQSQGRSPQSYFPESTGYRLSPDLSFFFLLILTQG